MKKSDFGLIGLAVMGQNLVLNMNDHGFKVAVYNRTVSKVDEFINGNAKGTEVVGTHSIEEFVSVLEKPRRFGLPGSHRLDEGRSEGSPVHGPVARGHLRRLGRRPERPARPAGPR